MLGLYELYRVSKEVEALKSLTAFSMNSKLRTEVYVPPLSYEVCGDNLSQTVNLRQLIRASHKSLECCLKGDCIILVDECYAVVPCHHAHHLYP